MPIVNIKMIAGRNAETKRVLAEKVTTAVADSLGVKPSAVWLVIEDMQPENFAQDGILMVDKKHEP